MDFDLVTLKMVVIADDAAQREALRGAAGMAPVPIDVVTFRLGHAAAAQDHLAQNAADIVFLDCGLAPAARAAMVDAARTTAERTFIILTGASAPSPQEQAIQPLDVDAIIEWPIDVLTASALVERCVRARLPNRVLVVDDSPTIRSIVRKMMRASRFSLETEESGEAESALDLVRSGRFDIVFLDCNMPGIDGFAALTEIARHHPRIGTVMMTGTPDQAIAERARAAGAKGCLFKPFFPKDIDAVLHGLFGLNARKAA